LQGTGVLVVLLGLYVVWFVTGKPMVKVDYLALLNQMDQPIVPEADNAWSHYEKALDAYTEPNEAIGSTTPQASGVWRASGSPCVFLW
jgi:hypothetical protein